MFPLSRASAVAAALLLSLESAAGLTLHEALRLAVQNSRAVRATESSVAGARESSRAAGELPDPMFRAGIENLPISGMDRFSTRDFMTMKRIGIAQEWTSADKRYARRAAAEAMVSREQAQLAAAAAEAKLQAALAYVDAFYASENHKLALLMQHHAQEERESGRARLAAASAGAQEVMALTSALALAEDDTAEAAQQLSAAEAALQRWIGPRPLDALSAPELSTAMREMEFVARHPMVVSAERDVEIARQAVAVASSETRPDWTWEVAYAQRSGFPDMVSIGVSVPLQLARDRRQDREIAARQAQLDKAQAQLEEARRAAAGEYAALASDAQRLEQRISGYRRSVLTAAEQRTAAALAAYRSNAGSLPSLFEARHAEVAAKRKLLGLERELARARAQLTLKPLSSEVTP